MTYHFRDFLHVLFRSHHESVGTYRVDSLLGRYPDLHARVVRSPSAPLPRRRALPRFLRKGACQKVRKRCVCSHFHAVRFCAHIWVRGMSLVHTTTLRGLRGPSARSSYAFVRGFGNYRGFHLNRIVSHLFVALPATW